MVFKSIPYYNKGRMNSSIVLAYLAIVLIISWILRMSPPEREHMEERKCPRNIEQGVCEQPVEGPRSEGEYPSMYGPTYRPRKPYNNDDGKFDSSTASDNTFYGNVLLKPIMSPPEFINAIPPVGPPEPYLTDFKAFQS
jgi:hypothetical protein